MTDLDPPSVDDIDTTQPHSARMYDYYLQGKDYYEVDQAAAAQVEAVSPARDRRAGQPAVHAPRDPWLAREAGIRQFLDIGTGIPTSPNLHQVAQEAAPESSVVYVDNDPIVLRHAEALMRSTPEGRTAYIQADVHRTRRSSSPGSCAETIDLDRPVALSLNALLHFVPDENQPYETVRSSGRRHCPPAAIWSSPTARRTSTRPCGRRIIDVYRSGGIPGQVPFAGRGAAFLRRARPRRAGRGGPAPLAAGRRVAEGATDAAVSLYVGGGAVSPDPRRR